MTKQELVNQKKFELTFLGLELGTLLSDDKTTKEIWRATLPFILAVIAGLLFIFVYALQFLPNFAVSASVYGTVAIVAVASLIGGGFVGFLFGVPRTLSQNGQENDPSSSAIQANTNLEQISDWLTKILVGVSLTQIKAILSAINTLTGILAPGFGDPNLSEPKPSSISLTLGILTYFTICGFFLGYLWARLYLPSQFVKADSLEELQHEVNAAKQSSNQLKYEIDEVSKAQRLVNRQLRTRFPEEKIDELRQALKNVPQDVRRNIFFQAQEVRSENWKFGKAKMERTIPIFKALVEIEPDYHRFHAELGFALKDKREPEWANALEELNQAISWRGNWADHGDWTTYYEFNRVICRINLDENFKDHRVSNTQLKNSIREDLQVVAEGGAISAEKIQDSVIVEWFELNDESFTDFLGQDLGQKLSELLAKD